MHKSSYSFDLPGSYYWEGLDNFFQKLTAMESPRKNNDCYFYYYSTCTKGDNCTFRHEPSALGCETMCSYWQQGKCLNQHCNFRHMELRKNRKAIPCYWETQPSGCRKPHCPFLHKNPRDAVSIEHPNVPAEGPSDQKNERSDWSRRQVENSQFDQSSAGEASNNDRNCVRSEPRRINQGSNDAATYGTPAVDPLVVNFEEESDNESISTTPIKCRNSRSTRIKTLEEIKLEKIQKESAAFYSYGDADADDLRRRIVTRLKTRNFPPCSSADFEILTVDEIRRRRSEDPDENGDPAKAVYVSDADLDVVRTDLRLNTKISLKRVREDRPDALRIKTLAEIRAERAARRHDDAGRTPEAVATRSSSDVFTEPDGSSRARRKRMKVCPKTEDTDVAVNEDRAPLQNDLSDRVQNISRVPDLLVNCSNVPDRDESMDEDISLDCVTRETFETDLNAVPAEDILRDIDAFLND